MNMSQIDWASSITVINLFLTIFNAWSLLAITKKKKQTMSRFEAFEKVEVSEGDQPATKYLAAQHFIDEVKERDGMGARLKYNFVVEYQISTHQLKELVLLGFSIKQYPPNMAATYHLTRLT